MEKSNPKAKIAIIIPNFNGIEHLKYCVPSILEAAHENILVAVIDDRSTDESKEWISTFSPNIVWVDNLRSQGFAGSVNTGIEWALDQGSDFIVISNNDIRLHRDTVSTLECFCAKYEGTKSFGLLGFKEINPPHTIGDIEVMLPSYEMGTLEDVKAIPGCFFVVSKAAIATVGYLDESYFMYGEDNDYFHRVLAGGMSIVQTQYPIWHRGEGSSKGSTRSSWLAYRNALKFSLKNQSILQISRTLLSLFNQAVNPLLKNRRSDPSYIRISRHSPALNLSFLIGSVGWNILHIKQTLKLRRSVKRVTR